MYIQGNTQVCIQQAGHTLEGVIPDKTTLYVALSSLSPLPNESLGTRLPTLMLSVIMSSVSIIIIVVNNNNTKRNRNFNNTFECSLVRTEMGTEKLEFKLCSIKFQTTTQNYIKCDEKFPSPRQQIPQYSLQPAEGILLTDDKCHMGVGQFC